MFKSTKLYYMSNGQVNVPIVVRFPGGNNGRGAQHAQCLESYFAHAPGLIVVAVSTPKDAYGLLRSAIQNNNPVMFFEHKLLYGNRGYSLNSDNDEPEIDNFYTDEKINIPIGKADIKMHGSELTIVCSQLMLHRSIKIAKEMKLLGIDIEVIDPRTLVPYDFETIGNSVDKTKKLLVIEEENGVCSWGATLIADMVERYSWDLKIKRISSPYTPVPYAAELINNYVPTEEKIRLGILEILEKE